MQTTEMLKKIFPVNTTTTLYISLGKGMKGKLNSDYLLFGYDKDTKQIIIKATKKEDQLAVKSKLNRFPNKELVLWLKSLVNANTYYFEFNEEKNYFNTINAKNKITDYTDIDLTNQEDYVKTNIIIDSIKGKDIETLSKDYGVCPLIVAEFILKYNQIGTVAFKEISLKEDNK